MRNFAARVATRSALLRDGAVREEGNGLDFVAWPMTPEAFAAVLRDDMARWPPIIAAASVGARIGPPVAAFAAMF